MALWNNDVDCGKLQLVIKRLNAEFDDAQNRLRDFESKEEHSWYVLLSNLHNSKQFIVEKMDATYI